MRDTRMAKVACICLILCSLLLLGVVLSGCAAIPHYTDMGVDGYNSPEGMAIREGIKAAVGPIAGTDWGNILGVLAGVLGGGYAVYKRKKWIDSKPPGPE